MRNRICILQCLADGFITNKNRNPTMPSFNEMVPILIEMNAKKVAPENAIWFNYIRWSYENTMMNANDPHAWLTLQFSRLGIYPVNETFQGRNISKHHCMTFVFDTLYSTIDNGICASTTFSPRAKNYQKTLLLPTERNELTPGDIIFYGNSDADTHIAIYLGRIDGTDYAVSKFGFNLNVYTHQIDHVSEVYGPRLTFYKHKNPLSAEVNHKINAISEELRLRLEYAKRQLLLYDCNKSSPVSSQTYNFWHKPTPSPSILVPTLPQLRWEDISANAP